MSDLYIDELVEGLRDVLTKQSSEFVFTSPGNTSLFPTSSSQAKWRYSKGPGFLRFHDGQKVYAFRLSGGMPHDQDFALKQEEDLEPSQFATGATEQGLMQVHRSDPGSIYFTLQEGRANPTFTLRHTGDENWRGSPKKKKVKEAVFHDVDTEALMEGVKKAFVQRALFSPGELVHNLGGGTDTLAGALGAGLVGAGGGAAYHLGRRSFYNTDEENEDEDAQGKGVLLKRMLLPALGLGAVGASQASLFPEMYKGLSAGAGEGYKVW